jgi:hypothetical protein
MAAQVLAFPQQPIVDASADPDEERGPYLPLSRLKKQLTSFLGAKTDEHTEAGQARRYYHGAQWDSKALKTLGDRRQPAVTFNRIKRKINVVCGVLEKLKQDPKAYPRTPNPQGEKGAELASQVLMYAIGWDWDRMCAEVARQAAVVGIAGVELVLTQGDKGDPEIDMIEVDSRDYFYDINSQKLDFSDSTYEGTTRWVNLEDAQFQWPDKAEELADNLPSSAPTPYPRDDDKRLKWWDHEEKRLRVVDHWYKRGGVWYYTIYSGDVILEEGESPFFDEKNKSACKYQMFSADVDHDNDRYGFYRDWKGPQDEINQRRSKALHLLNTRRAIIERGAVDDIELARRELARPDGLVEKNKGYEFNLDDTRSLADAKGNMEMLQEAKAEIDQYGPNPGLASSQVDPTSGRMIELLQAAGIAELGPYFLAFRQWKLRVYRATWNAVQRYWTQERWMRVTDDQDLAQFVKLNGWEMDQNGLPVAINQLAALDVDIILAEGPNAINTMSDAFDSLVGLAKTGTTVPPELIVELSSLPASVKKRAMSYLVQSQQPKPHDLQAIQIKLQQELARAQEIAAHAQLYVAQAQKAGAEASVAGVPDASGAAPPQVDTPADLAKANLDLAKAKQIYHELNRHPEPGMMEDAQAKAAKAEKDRADAQRTRYETANIARHGAAEPAMIPPPRPPGGGSSE